MENNSTLKIIIPKQATREFAIDGVVVGLESLFYNRRKHLPEYVKKCVSDFFDKGLLREEQEFFSLQRSSADGDNFFITATLKD